MSRTTEFGPTNAAELLQCQLCRVAFAAFEMAINVRSGLLANGKGWYDTIDGCDCAESMVLAFEKKMEIWAKYALT